ncbi:MAG: alpha/beta hydrolase [Bacteroidetes bacterium]|nr:MAG: alpha/beta hydrolase [Bacteroidota bacterium]
MTKKLFLFSLILIIICSESKLFANVSDNKVRYIDVVFEQIGIETDIVFGESVNEKGETEKLKLDIYRPEGDKLKKRPVIVWIHGGGFRPGNDKTQSYIVEMASRFARKGYVCLSIDYRVRENPKENIESTIADAVADAHKALAWLRKNGKSLKVDTSKIIIGGGSAGGILGSNLCFNNKFSDDYDKAGILGFVNLWGSPGAGWGEIEVEKNSLPTIIVHGTEDALVAYENSVKLVEKLNGYGIRNELVTLEGAGHTPVKYMDDFEKKIAAFLYEIIK